MKKLTVEIPDEFLDWAEESQAPPERLLAEAMVAELLRQRQISSGRASELLGISRWDLPDWLSRHQVCVVDFTPQDLEPF